MSLISEILVPPVSIVVIGGAAGIEQGRMQHLATCPQQQPLCTKKWELPRMEWHYSIMFQRISWLLDNVVW